MITLNYQIVFVLFQILKHETLTAIPPIHVYINRISNRIVFKTKDGYIARITNAEKIILFGITKTN